MANVDVGDVLRFGCVQVFNGTVDIVNVFHVEVVATPAGGFSAIAGDIQEYCDTMFATIASALSDMVNSDRISVSNETQGLVFGSIEWDSFAGGSNVADVTAPGVCCLTWARTVYPRVQMRKYLGPFTEADMTDGTWAGGLTTACNNLLDYHIALQELDDGLQVVGIAYNKALDRRAGAISTTVSANPVYQRRRRLGAGS